MNKPIKAGELVHKTSISVSKADKGLEFILSDASVDRYGDVIAVEGWDLKNFNNNPIALFNHNPDFPVGSWENLRAQDGALRGRLKLAPAGTSPRMDEIRALVDAGILKAVSVGFRPLEYKPRSGEGGFGQTYVRSELVETSLVSVPANPNALAVAKQLKISDATMQMVFAGYGAGDLRTRAFGHNGEHAEIPPSARTKMTTPIAIRIGAVEQRIVQLRDDLTKHLEKIDDANPTEDQTAITEGFNSQIETQERQLAALKKAEGQLAGSAQLHQQQQPGPQPGSLFRSEPTPRTEQPLTLRGDGRVFAAPAGPQPKGADFLWRALAVQFMSAVDRQRQPAVEILKGAYGECDRTYHMFNVINRAASAPAMTSTSGWADTLVQTVLADLIESLIPYSIYPRLAALGRRYTFGRNGTISIPARTVATSVGGAFVLQGNAIPVKQGAFSAVTIGPKKMGVITTLTREMAEHSIPSLEGILRQAVLEDTGVALDTVLTDATAVSATRPPGLKNGVTKVTASSATPILNAFVADVQGLVAALTTNTSGNIRAPVFIMNPADVLKASLLQTTTGDFAFPNIKETGSLLGIPIIQSTVGTSDVMFLVDAADFATATGDAPRFDMSDQAVLHMEDTSPTALSAVATPNTVAAPARSLFQTDSMALRMILDVNWVLVRTGTVQWTDGMGWN